MVTHYPHTLTYALEGTPSEYNESTGEWTAEISGALKEVTCRARPSRPNTARPLQDGTITQCSFDLAFPKGSTVVPEGAICTVKGVRGEVLITAPLIDYQEGNISVRGWI